MQGAALGRTGPTGGRRDKGGTDVHVMRIAIGVALLCGGVAAQAAETPMLQGKVVKFKNKAGTVFDQALVKFVKEASLTAPLPDPRCPAASSIRLTTDGQDVVRPLDCAKWVQKGTGYAYQDKTGGSGGVFKVQVKPGKLLAKLKGAGYGVDGIGGPINLFEFRLAVDDDTYCGRFISPTSEFKKNETEKIIIKGPSQGCAPLPTATPTATATGTNTATPTVTATATATATATVTNTRTITPTPTVTFTPTDGPSPTPTATLVPADAFRITTLALRDPHIMAPVLGCHDGTDPPGVFGVFSANGELADLLSNDSEPDGFLDLSLLALFRPLSQPPVAGGDIEIAVGQCTAPVGTEVCSPDGESLAGTVYSNQAAGTCLSPLAGTFGMDNTTPYSPAITSSTAPCFATAPQTFTFPLGLFDLTLANVRASARYVGDPANNVIEGLLFGFLSEEDANNTLLPDDLPIFFGQPISVLLPGGSGNCAEHDDRDLGPGGQPGWYFYLNFTAHRVVWTGP